MRRLWYHAFMALRQASHCTSRTDFASGVYIVWPSTVSEQGILTLSGGHYVFSYLRAWLNQPAV